MDKLETRVRQVDRDLLIGVAMRCDREIRRMYKGEIPFNQKRRTTLDRIAQLAVSEHVRPMKEALMKTDANRAQIKLVK